MKPLSHVFSRLRSSENQPPVLQATPLLLRSFQGENLLYQLQARDPEDSPVLFALEAGPEGVSLTPAGLLMWKASANTGDTHTVQFSVRDDCDAETKGSVQVTGGFSLVSHDLRFISV